MNYIMEFIVFISHILTISAILYATYKAKWPWWAALLIIFVVPFLQYKHDPELQKNVRFHRAYSTIENLK